MWQLLGSLTKIWEKLHEHLSWKSQEEFRRKRLETFWKTNSHLISNFPVVFSSSRKFQKRLRGKFSARIWNQRILKVNELKILYSYCHPHSKPSFNNQELLDTDFIENKIMVNGRPWGVDVAWRRCSYNKMVVLRQVRYWHKKKLWLFGVNVILYDFLHSKWNPEMIYDSRFIVFYA